MLSAVALECKSLFYWALRIERSAEPESALAVWVARAIRLILTALALAVVFGLLGEGEPVSVAMLFTLAVTLTGLRWGTLPAIAVSIPGALILDYFFVSPLHSLSIFTSWHLATTASLIVAGVVSSGIAKHARGRAAHARALCSFSESLALASSVEQIAFALASRIRETLHLSAVVFLPRGGNLEPVLPAADFSPGTGDRANAAAVFRAGKESGRRSSMETRTWFLPLQTPRAVLGVLGVRSNPRVLGWLPDRDRLIDAFASHATLAMERALLQKEAVEAELLREAGKLHNTLLSSVSHHLRSPLSSIIGTLGTVIECDGRLNNSAWRQLLEGAQEEAGRLNRTVTNLLDIARLEAGAAPLRIEPCDFEELIGAALEEIRDRVRDRPIIVRVPEHPPLVQLDLVLTTQVLVNLLDNALKYSPSAAPIEIEGELSGDLAKIRVLDRGEGIPLKDLAGIFDKFNRAGREADASGIGLGLAVCKGFVEAQGGRIWLEPRAGGGTVATFTLPLEPVTHCGGRA